MWLFSVSGVTAYSILSCQGSMNMSWRFWRQGEPPCLPVHLSIYLSLLLTVHFFTFCLPVSLCLCFLLFYPVLEVPPDPPSLFPVLPTPGAPLFIPRPVFSLPQAAYLPD